MGRRAITMNWRHRPESREDRVGDDVASLPWEGVSRPKTVAMGSTPALLAVVALK